MKKFNKQERRDIAAAFVNAKEWLRTEHSFNQTGLPRGVTRFICIAIGEGYSATYEKVESGELRMSISALRRREMATENAINVISERIEGRYSVAQWLQINRITTKTFLDTRFGRSQLQLYRHRWLDAMIEEFSSKGKQ